MKRRRAEIRGRRGEIIAAWWLRLHGWRILATRAKTRFGEVDLIARRGNMIAFIEVKTRATLAELDIAIDRRRLTRVAAAANLLAARYAPDGVDIRIDVMLIHPWAWPRHLTNVWHG
ncbi:YraN family protein [Sphingobium boeckii]|uniref:UPF0102 protein FHS49_003012 n=1 Tax=Sphingobium boeckii TaxID=1082345 RepID=A0A7W9AJS2_9SPHN|nr:putative endonuclease [Sphingobium boeckii]